MNQNAKIMISLRKGNIFIGCETAGYHLLFRFEGKTKQTAFKILEIFYFILLNCFHLRVLFTFILDLLYTLCAENI